MEEFKTSDIVFKPKWVIVDGIPPLIQSNDYKRYATALEEAARNIANGGSKKEPIVYIPHETTKVSRHSEETKIFGCAFIQFGTENDAKQFSKHYRNQNATLRQLTDLRCYTSSDIEKYEQMDDDYHKLSKDEFQKNRNLLWWLLDEDGGESFRDQYVIRFTGQEFEETHVYWMDKNEVKTGRKLCYDAAELKIDRKEMTRQYVEWSPNGYYLLTTHRQGVQLWGGYKWSSLQKLEHPRVDQMSFSPNETFLITCNATSYEQSGGGRQSPQLKIWDVLTGDLIISVSSATIGPAIKLRLPGWWPIFKWSADEKYIAKINSSRGLSAKPKDINKINIFHVRLKTEDEMASSDDSVRYKIEKLGGKSLTVDSLFNMEFSPTDNILAYTSFAQNDDQAKVTLISIPSKNSLKVQTLGFDVKKCHLYWQSQGRYLAINMAHSQSKSNILIKSHSIGIMTVKDKKMPFSRTEKLGMVIYFSWEPDGNRFAVIHGGTRKIEPNVSIYRVQDIGVDQGKSRLILKLPKRRCNELYWAPYGGRLVIANVDKTRRAGGELEFVDINKIRTTNDESNTVKNIIHENMTDIEWDPSGRYLITATTQYLNSTSGDDTRYIVWSFQGEKLFEHKIKYFYQILWRPRPKKLFKITNKDKQIINSKLSHHGWSDKFQKHDLIKTTEKINKKILENQKKLTRYNQKLKSLKQRSENILAKRNELRGYSASNYTTRTIQQKLEKSKSEYVIPKDVMRKIISEEIDFNQWKDNQ